MAALQNPLKNWRVNREEIQYLGHDLQRPECILTEPNGTVWTADARGGVVKLGPPAPDGGVFTSQQFIGLKIETAPIGGWGAVYIQAVGSLPNGICFDTNGDFIIANWGTNHIEKMTRDGKLTTVLTEIDGKPLGKTNFPLRDSKGRIWFTVTTQTEPWSDQINTRATDGYIALMDEKGVRMVADGFCGTNEIRFDDNEEWLYVVESTAWKISRMRVKPNGDLYGREVYGPSKLGGFPDGFAFDAFGNLWVTLIFTDELIAITPEGEVITLLDDSDPETKKRLFDAYENRCVTPEILAATQGKVCPWMASLSFGGADLKTVYLGSLRGAKIPYFQSPVAGQKMIHWR
ncbi:SMP-30/gluconolactonase/LRE family protein [Runella sp.]|jgi:gluconolactonase|uniref:SMP-30/gluconolactonase/LRE family protein n=1 Tax=Runella sp. TaxID=1960881 RepID=UPI00262ED812|nr:SMP-30/gluconolactonase/LRE family protein [Runella sp.]